MTFSACSNSIRHPSHTNTHIHSLVFTYTTHRYISHVHMHIPGGQRAETCSSRSLTDMALAKWVTSECLRSLAARPTSSRRNFWTSSQNVSCFVFGGIQNTCESTVLVAPLHLRRQTNVSHSSNVPLSSQKCGYLQGWARSVSYSGDASFGVSTIPGDYNSWIVQQNLVGRSLDWQTPHDAHQLSTKHS